MSYRVTAPGGVKLLQSTRLELIAQGVVSHLRDASDRRLFISEGGNTLEIRQVLADGEPMPIFTEHPSNPNYPPAWFGNATQLVASFWRKP